MNTAPPSTIHLWCLESAHVEIASRGSSPSTDESASGFVLADGSDPTLRHRVAAATADPTPPSSTSRGFPTSSLVAHHSQSIRRPSNEERHRVTRIDPLIFSPHL